MNVSRLTRPSPTAIVFPRPKCVLSRQKNGTVAKCAAALLWLTLPNAMLLGGPIPSEVPDSWTIEIETTGFYLSDSLLISITTFRPNVHELVVRYRPKRTEKSNVVILVDQIKQSEARKYWDAFVAMQSRFKLTAKNLQLMDGGFLSIELSMGTEALGMRYWGFHSLEDIAPELVPPLAKIKRLAADKVIKERRK